MGLWNYYLLEITLSKITAAVLYRYTNRSLFNIHHNELVYLCEITVYCNTVLVFVVVIVVVIVYFRYSKKLNNLIRFTDNEQTKELIKNGKKELKNSELIN